MLNLLKIRIQNFRNLKDVTIDLKDVHLFIGPNNSGKSNVLQAIRLGSMIVGKNLRNQDKTKYAESISSDEYNAGIKSIGSKNKESCILAFLFQANEKKYLHLIIEIINFRIFLFFGLMDDEEVFVKNSLNEFIELSLYDFFETDSNVVIRRARNAKFRLIDHAYQKLMNTYVYIKDPLSSEIDTNKINLSDTVFEKFTDLPIYEISPKSLRMQYGITGDKYILNDGSNIVSFLDSIMSRDNGNYEKLRKTLSLITKDFSGFILDIPETVDLKVKNLFPKSTIKKFGLIDSRNKENTIWAESLSDGILYFLAILCIVHQPNPPAIVLIEEPEKGIHPRRIKEVMDLLFALADEKKIQIILTTHSTFVVNEFKDLPENISVFENTDSVITIQNLKTEIIKKLDADIEKQGYEKVDFTDSLGENWALGLLGGVPI